MLEVLQLVHLLEDHQLDLQEEDHLQGHQAIHQQEVLLEEVHQVDHQVQWAEVLHLVHQALQLLQAEVHQLHRVEADQELLLLQAVVRQVLLLLLAEELPFQLDEVAQVPVEVVPDVVELQVQKKHNRQNHQSNPALS